MAARVPPTTRASMGLVDAETWARASGDERDAIRAFACHLRIRFAQDRYAPFEEVDGRGDCVFLTNGWMKARLRDVRARKTGEKAARVAIKTLVRLGVLEDTGETKKPLRSLSEIAAAEKFQPAGTPITEEGGQYAQPSTLRSRWWRVFRVVPVNIIMREFRRLGAYDSGHVPEVPHHLRCLLARLRRQGLIRRRRPPSDFSKRSVQEQFAVLGPP